ncbi:hypothetical protein R2360_13850 [Mycobacteroides chelonae]|nr:hypothetical protein [Mycobacteroides chelonae]MEC4843301.1 hypothetical protein [Mycobacteroides chelonae]
MVDTSDLSPEVLHALKTGELPPDPNATAAEAAQEAHASDAERLRAKYHRMVDERIADWVAAQEDRGIGALADYCGPAVPAGVREQIEADCNRQIQYEWRQILQRQEDDDEDW